MNKIEFLDRIRDRPVASPPSELRNPCIEYLRIISAFCIVWFHSGTQGYQVAYSGLASFVIITFYFETVRSPYRSLQLDILFLRLGVPWIFWMATFAIYNIARHKYALLPTNGLIESILYGSAPHLWYLPFLFILQSIYRSMRNFGATGFIGLICALGVPLSFIFTQYWRAGSIAAGPPIAQYAQASIGVGFGILCGLTVQNRVWLPALVAGLMAAWSAIDVVGVGLPYLIAASAVIVAILLGPRYQSLPDPTPISRLMYGVYLIHLPILGLAKVKFHGPLMVVSVFCAAAVLIWAIRYFSGKLGLLITGDGDRAFSDRSESGGIPNRQKI